MAEGGERGEIRIKIKIKFRIEIEIEFENGRRDCVMRISGLGLGRFGASDCPRDR
jgi:hypothetical protein